MATAAAASAVSGWVVRCSSCGRRCYASIFIQWSSPDRPVRLYSFCSGCSKMRAPTPAELKANGKEPGEFWKAILDGIDREVNA